MKKNTNQKKPKRLAWKKRDILISLAVVLILVFLAIRAGILPGREKLEKLTQYKLEIEKPTPIVEEFKVPQGWKRVEKDGEKVELKLEKETKAKIKPIIVLIKSETKETDFASYVDKLIKGAKSALPSLRINSDEEVEKQAYYGRGLTGYYYKGYNRVDIKQTIYIKDNQVYTITASTDPAETEALKDEIESIFDSIFNFYIAS